MRIVRYQFDIILVRQQQDKLNGLRFAFNAGAKISIIYSVVFCVESDVVHQSRKFDAILYMCVSGVLLYVHTFMEIVGDVEINLSNLNE